MPAVRNVLIVGGGTAGSALAILLARAGVMVDIAEIQPSVTALGSGITLQGNALQVLRDLGVWDRAGAGMSPALPAAARLSDLDCVFPCAAPSSCSKLVVANHLQ